MPAEPPHTARGSCRSCGDHVTARARLEVEHELLDPDRRDDGLLGALLLAGVVCGSCGRSATTSTNSMAKNGSDETAADEDPSCEAEAHLPILSRHGGRHRILTPQGASRATSSSTASPSRSSARTGWRSPARTGRARRRCSARSQARCRSTAASWRSQKGTRIALHDQRPPAQSPRPLREYVLAGTADLAAVEEELRTLERAMAAGDARRRRRCGATRRRRRGSSTPAATTGATAPLRSCAVSASPTPTSTGRSRRSRAAS